jgi:hypothetical protein
VGKRIITMGLAAVFIALGVFFAVFPGPAMPFFFVGGALLSTHSRAIARVMDWLEVRGRTVFAWLKKRWRHLPLAGRIAVVVVAMACSVTGMFFMHRLFYG